MMCPAVELSTYNFYVSWFGSYKNRLFCRRRNFNSIWERLQAFLENTFTSTHALLRQKYTQNITMAILCFTCKKKFESQQNGLSTSTIHGPRQNQELVVHVAERAERDNQTSGKRRFAPRNSMQCQVYQQKRPNYIVTSGKVPEKA